MVNTGSGFKITVSGASGSANSFVLNSEEKPIGVRIVDFGDFGERAQISESSKVYASEDSPMAIDVVTVKLGDQVAERLNLISPTPKALCIAINNLQSSSVFAKSTDSIPRLENEDPILKVVVKLGDQPDVSIDITDATLAGVAKAIKDANLGFTAEVVSSGSGFKIKIRDTSINNVPISLSSNRTALKFDGDFKADYTSAGKLRVMGPGGDANAFSLITDNGDALDFVQKQSAKTLCMAKPLQEAKDAALQVDGLPISSTSNAVSGVIAGVTLNLTGINATQVNGDLIAKGAPASLSLNIDTSVAKTKITALVTAYNDASDLLDQVSNPKSSLATYGGTLVGNSSVRSMREKLRELVTQDFFSGGSWESANPSQTRPAKNTGPSHALEALRDIGIEVTSKGKLTTNSVKLDMALALNFADTVTLLSGNQENQPSSDTKTVSGLAGDASKTLTAMLGTSGTITVETENANKRITKYQDDLTALDDRMTMILARYQKQFAAMDNMVGQTKNTQTGLTSTFAGMMAMYTNK